MAQTMMETESPLFSRVVETRRTSSWRAAAPAVLILVAMVILIAYLASKVSSYSQQASMAQQDATAAHQQLEATQKQTGTLQSDLATARSAGRTTVLLESKAKGAKSWAAATWGEGEDGKSWVRLMAYGLATPPEGKEYRAWMQPQSGAPVDAGRLDPAQDGTAFSLAKNLPAIDQGKRLVVSLEDENAKQPGDALMAVDLPKLQATKSAAQAAPASDAAPKTAGDDAAAGQKAGGTKSPADATR